MAVLLAFNATVIVEPSLGRRYPGGQLSEVAFSVDQKLPVGISYHMTGVMGLTGLYAKGP